MPKWIPERPTYRKERLLAGMLAFSSFLLLFAARLAEVKKGFALFSSLPLALLSECVVFLLPLVVFCLVRGGGYFAYLRVKPPRPAHTLFLISAFFALFSGCLLLSLLCKGTDSLGNSATVFEHGGAGGFWRGLGAFFVFVFLPAILEEFLFRGVLVAEYERRGGVRAVLMTTLLFAFIHFDIRNFAVYLFSGLLFALVLFATDSVISTMILHVLYNTVSFFGQRYLNLFYNLTGSVELFLFFLILIFLVSLLFFCKEAGKFYRIYDCVGENPRRNVPYAVQFYTVLDALLDPAVLGCIVLSVLGMIFL